MPNSIKKTTTTGSPNAHRPHSHPRLRPRTRLLHRFRSHDPRLRSRTHAAGSYLHFVGAEKLPGYLACESTLRIGDGTTSVVAAATEFAVGTRRSNPQRGQLIPPTGILRCLSRFDSDKPGRFNAWGTHRRLLPRDRGDRPRDPRLHGLGSTFSTEPHSSSPSPPPRSFRRAGERPQFDDCAGTDTQPSPITKETPE